MWAPGGKRQAVEPAWVKVAQAILIHGERAAEMPQADFWPLVVGLNGKVPAKNTSSEAVDDLDRWGRYLMKKPLRFGPGMGLVLGVSVGSESLRAALFDANGQICARRGGPACAEGDDPERHASEAEPIADQLLLSRVHLLERVVDLVRHVALRGLEDPELAWRGSLPLLGVSVAWPTPLNRWTKVPASRKLRSSEWRTRTGHISVPGLDQQVAECFNLPVSRAHAINDANAVALGEAFDRSRSPAVAVGSRLGGTVMALKISGGLGAGTIVMGSPPNDTIDGPEGPKVHRRPRSSFLYSRLLEGTGGAAGELGHWQVPIADLDEVFGTGNDDDDANGTDLVRLGERKCICGRPRCLERYASSSAFIERMRVSGVPVEGLRDGKARANVSQMHGVMEEAADDRQIEGQKDIGKLIGRSLSAPVLMLNPEVLVMAGSLAVDQVITGIRQEQGRWAHVHEDEIEIKPLRGMANKFAAARGAALAAFRGGLYRRLDDERLELGRLTVPLDRAMVDAWRVASADEPGRRPGE